MNFRVRFRVFLFNMAAVCEAVLGGFRKITAWSSISSSFFTGNVEKMNWTPSTYQNQFTRILPIAAPALMTGNGYAFNIRLAYWHWPSMVWICASHWAAVTMWPDKRFNYCHVLNLLVEKVADLPVASCGFVVIYIGLSIQRVALVGVFSTGWINYAAIHFVAIQNDGSTFK